MKLFIRVLITFAILYLIFLVSLNWGYDLGFVKGTYKERDRCGIIVDNLLDKMKGTERN